MNDYSEFSQNNFIEDEYFREWVNQPSEKTRIFWEAYIKEYPEKRKEIETAKLIIKYMVPAEQDLSEIEIDSLWTSIVDTTTGRKRRVRRLWYPVAAAGILIFLASIWWINSQNHENFNVVDYSQLIPAKTVTNDIELILADETKVKISEKESEIKYDNNGRLVINSSKAILQETVKKNDESVLLNSILVPKGKRANIAFADGTKLWLNSGSSAIYPVEFTDKKREIYIKGEGFFEVEHNDSRPFIVKTDKMDIEVLGTSFNVCAYPDDEISRVILVKGKIVAKSINNPKVILLPNQMISYNSKSQKTDVAEVKVEDYISWKDGWLLCNSEELSSVVGKLERYYDQKIFFSDESARHYRLSGKLDLKDNFNQVLQVIATTAPVKIKVENDSIRISSN